MSSFVQAADETIVITTPEPHAITDAYAIIKVLLEENKKLKLKLMINKCESTFEGNAVMKRLSRVVHDFLSYNNKPLGCMLESKAVSRSIRQQAPFMTSQPNSDVTKFMRSVAEAEEMKTLSYHATDEEDEEGNEGALKNTSFVGRFMRLFRTA